MYMYIQYELCTVHACMHTPYGVHMYSTYLYVPYIYICVVEGDG